MKSKSSEQTNPRLTHTNLLDDLGFSPSEALEIKVKAEIYRELLRYIHDQAFTQQELCTLLGIHQPDVSNLLNGRVSKFSVSKLIRFAGKLDLRAEIKLLKPRRAKPPAIFSATSKKRAAVVA